MFLARRKDQECKDTDRNRHGTCHSGTVGNDVFTQTITVTTLTDSADPPFNADGFCGTGTVSDLPRADGLVSLLAAGDTSCSWPLYL